MKQQQIQLKPRRHARHGDEIVDLPTTRGNTVADAAGEFLSRLDEILEDV